MNKKYYSASEPYRAVKLSITASISRKHNSISRTVKHNSISRN